MIRRIAPLSAAVALALQVPAMAAPAVSDFKLIDRIPGPDAGGWDYAAVDAKHGRVLIGRTGGVMTVDMASRAVRPVLASGAGVHAALPVNGGDQVLITNGGTNTVTVVDSETGAQVATVATGANPDAATFDSFSGLVLVMDHSGGDVRLIDPKTWTSVGAIAIGGDLEAAAANGAGLAYVNVEDKAQVAVIDIAARKVMARYALPGCEGPTGIAYVAAAKMLILSCDGVVDLVAADTGKTIRLIKIGGGADGVAYDAKRNLAFVPSGEDGTLNVLSVAGRDAKLVQIVKTEKGARTLTVDEGTGRVYLPTGRFNPPAPGQRRGGLVPGSFATLVVGR